MKMTFRQAMKKKVVTKESDNLNFSSKDKNFTLLIWGGELILKVKDSSGVEYKNARSLINLAVYFGNTKLNFKK